MRDDARADMEQRLNAACAGDTEAIAALIERSLMLSQVAVRARIEGRCLYLILYGQAGQQDSLVRFIKSGLQQIRIEGVDEIDISVYSDNSGQGEPAWSYRGQLRPSQSTSSLASPKSIPASTSARRVMTGHYSTQWTTSGIRLDATSSSPQRWIPQSAAPPATQELFDRQSAVHKAINTIKSGAPLQVYGPSGTGKTTFLRNLIHQQAVQQFGDGIVYVEAYKSLSTDLLQHLFEALYRSDNAVPTKPTLPEIHHALRSRNSLAVVDQTEAIDSLEPLIDTVPLLLAARTCYLWQQGEVIPLEAFSDHEALTFLELRLGRPLSADEQRAALDLCHHLKGNPALLTQHAALVRRGRSFAELAQQIDAGFSPDTLVMRAASDLADEERRLLATLAVFGPVPIQAHHLQAIAGVDSASLTELQSRGLVWGHDAYRLASNLIAPLQQVWDLTPWYERAVHYFTSWAITHQERMPATGEAPSPDTLAMLDLLWRLLERAVDQSRWTDSLSLCRALDPLLYQYCRWGRWQQVWQLGRKAAQETGDRAAEAWALHQMGSVALCLDDGFAAQAHLAEAQQLRQQAGDMVGAALSQHNLAVVQQVFGKQVARSEAPRPAPSSAAGPAAAFVSMPQQLPLKWLLIGGAVTLAGIAAAVFGFQSGSSEVSVRRRLINFPPQLLSTTSETREIVVRNSSSESVSIDEIILNQSSGEADGEGSFQIQEDCTDAPLSPDAICTIEAQFTPQAEGPDAATVSIVDDGQTIKTVTLRGVGADADAELRPKTLEFEPLSPDAEPVTQSVEVRNVGAVAFTVDSVILEESEAFSIEADECVGQTLDTRDTCRVVVQFDPPEPGTFAATLTLNNQTRSSFWTLPISSAAPEPAAAPRPNTTRTSRSPRFPLPSISLPPIFNPSPSPSTPPQPRPKAQIAPSTESVVFGDQPAGSIQTQRITLTNTGNGALYFDSIGLKETNDFAIAGTDCGLLQPDENCVVAVEFLPQGGGEFTTELEINSNIETRAIPVSGTAVARARPPQPSPATPKVPEIQQLSLSADAIGPGESVDLCYDVTNADTLSFSDGQGTTRLQNMAECLSLTPQATTTYTFVAQAGDERTERSVTVTVAEASQPDAAPLTTPTPVSPGAAGDVLPVTCVASPVILRWTGSGSAYEVMLEREETVDDRPVWSPVLSESVGQTQLDVSAAVGNFGLHRWKVRSLDSAGNASPDSAWQYFTCVVE